MSNSFYSFIFFLFLSFGLQQNASSQTFYVSSTKACIEDNSDTGVGSDPSAALGGGCNNQIQAFDTELNAVAWSWTLNGQQISTDRNPRITFETKGVQPLSLTRTLANGSTSTSSENITVSAFEGTEPSFSGKSVADSTVCGTDIVLDPYKGITAGIGSGNLTYLWAPNGETTETITINENGCYSVEVTDENGCSKVASVNVTFCLQESDSDGGNEKWYFGNKGAIEFGINYVEVPIDSTDLTKGELFGDPEFEENGFDVGSSSTENILNNLWANAMLFGSNNELLFYTNGTQLLNGNNDIIETALGFNSNKQQGVAIVPKPTCNECKHHEYYVFGINDENILEYSILDTRLSEGLGGISKRNIPFIYEVDDRITALSNSDDSGYLLVSHEANNAAFNLSLIDTSGILNNRQLIGTDLSTVTSLGEISVSFDKTKIAHAFIENGVNFVEVLDLDVTSGIVSNPRKIEISDLETSFFGIEFAEDSNVLYVSVFGDGSQSSLIQFDLSLNSTELITENKKIIIENSIYNLAGLKLGPQNTGTSAKQLYISSAFRNGSIFLQTPNELEDDDPLTDLVGVVINGPELNSQMGFVFPTIIFLPQENSSSGITGTFEGVCLGVETQLEVEEACSPLYNIITWQFANGDTREGKSVNYTFETAGEQPITVTYEIFEQSKIEEIAKKAGVPVDQISKIVDLKKLLGAPCQTSSKTDTLTIYPAPVFSVDDSLAACLRAASGTGVAFAPTVSPTVTGGGEPFEYEWLTELGVPLPGATPTTTSVEFTGIGNYILNITNVFNCTATEEFSVYEDCSPSVWAPTAFTPNNGDLANNYFDVNTFLVGEYNLYVYNRWGELIFESNNPETKWDGAVKGVIYPNTTYAYRVFYKSKFSDNPKVYKKLGTIRILR